METPQPITALASLASENFAYLTTTGRTSGRPHEIEIWFAVHPLTVYLISGGRDRSDWVRNLLADPAASIRIGDHTFSVTARVGDVIKEGERTLAARVLHAKYGGQTSGTFEDWRTKAFFVALDVVR
jgi:deazaflavin-dependent oxidoreductase (nitroreductase family)